MSSVGHDASGTPDPGLLLRHLDGDLDAATADALEAHLDGCARCRERLAALEARNGRVRRLIRSADFEPPPEGAWGDVRARLTRGQPGPRSRRVRRLLVAAGLAAVLGTAVVAAPPLRAWLVDRWGQGVGGREDPAPPAGEEEPGRADLTFRPPGPTLEIALQNLQAGGVLTLRFTEGASATVSVSGGGSERLSVGRDGLNVRNAGTAVASYDVTLPSSIERAWVRIGEVDPIRVTRDETGPTPLTVDLERGVVVRNGGLRDEPGMDDGDRTG